MVFAFVAAYALDAWLQTPWFSWWLGHRHWGDFIMQVLGGLAHGYGPLLYGATAMAALATLARFEHAGLGARFGVLAKRHPVVLHRVLPWMVGALWVASNVAFVAGGWRIYVDGFELGTLLAAIGMGLVVRAGVSELERVPSAQDEAAPRHPSWSWLR